MMERMRPTLNVLVLLLWAAFGSMCGWSNVRTHAYSPQQQQPPAAAATTNNNKKELMKRRLFFAKAASTAVVSSAAILLAKPKEAHGEVLGGSGVISGKYCAYGEGDGCDDLAEGNAFILELQRKSAANKETAQQDAKNAFYMKNYPDWFASVGKSMVKKADGTFMVVSDQELAALKADNKIGLEYARTMGGKVADVTQKPIMVLKE